MTTHLLLAALLAAPLLLRRRPLRSERERRLRMLRSAAVAARAPGGDPRRAWLEATAREAGGLAAVGWEALPRALHAARRAGVCPAAGLRGLVRELERAERHERAVSLVAAVHRGRLLGGLALAVAARFGLYALGPPAAPAGGPTDAGALGLALALVVLQLALLARWAPESWVWHPRSAGLSRAAVSWLDAWLDPGRPPGDALAAAWAALRRQELREGVDLTSEKRRALRAWAAGARREGAVRRRGLVEALPAVELVGIGLPAALVLLEPARLLIG